MKNLPKTWDLAKISEVADINSRLEKELDDNILASFIPMRCVEEENGKFVSLENRKVKDVRKGYTPFKDGDVIFAKVTPCMENGKAAVLKNLTNGIGFGSTEFFTLRPKVGLIPEYLYFFITQQSFRREAARNMTGAVGLRRVPTNYLAAQLIPFPSLGNQQLIVEEIEKQFTRLEVGVAALKRMQSNLKRYRASIFKSASEGKLVTSDQTQWIQMTIEKCFTSLEDGRTLHQGWSPQCEKESSLSSDEWGVLKTTSIQAGEFQPKYNKRLPSKLSPRPLLEVKEGDILMTCAGPRDRCGVSCLVRKTRPRLMISGKMYRFRVDTNRFEPRYMEAFLQSEKVRAAIDKMKTGISDSGLNLTHDRFRQLLIQVPPIEEQKQIMAEVDRHLSVVGKLEMVIKLNLDRAMRLRQAILNQAFSGKLVPQD